MRRNNEGGNGPQREMLGNEVECARLGKNLEEHWGEIKKGTESFGGIVDCSLII